MYFLTFLLVLTTTAISAENLTAPTPTNEFFINSVHQIAASLSKDLVIHDNRVVWSPFLVVNAIQAVRNDNKLLQNGFETAFTYLESSLNTTLISAAYSNVLNSTRNLQVNKVDPSKGENIGDVLQQKFESITGNNNSDHNGTERLEIPKSETVILTTLGIESLWETPFHPRYAKKGKFFLNSTHVVKTKFMNNIGFYKYFNGSDYSGVALPLKDSHKVYLILMTPKDIDGVEDLHQQIENTNFTSVFQQFKTKRVQLSVPRVNIDSQFLLNITNTTRLLSMTSLKISYTGLYNSFKPPSTPYRPIKFTRLRRRKDDMKMSINSPFVFYVYDSQISGILMSGIILNPLEIEPILSPQVNTEVKLGRQQSNDNCFQTYQSNRKNSSIFSNLHFNCLELYNVSDSYKKELNSSSNLKLVFPTVKKTKMANFYRNEIEFDERDFFQITGKVKYMSYGPFDFKVVKVVNLDKAIYFLIPNERSGLYLIEEGLEVYNFERLLCQLRETHLRLVVPQIKYKGENGTTFDLKGVKYDDENGDSNEVPYDDEAVVDDEEEKDKPLVQQREARKRNKRYRKIKVDRPFMYVVTEELNTQGGIISIGRFVGDEIDLEQEATTLLSKLMD